MTQTSEERREVAGLMRDEAAGFRRLGEEHGDAWTVDLGDVPAIFQDIAHYVGLDGVVRADALFDRLADLIDSTCEIVEDEPYSCHCSACGQGRMYPQMYWRYCPHCGARAVGL